MERLTDEQRERVATETVADESLAGVVKAHVLAVCERCDWNLPEAAKRLKVSLKTVYNHLNRYGV